jgi:hypothetical protein
MAARRGVVASESMEDHPMLAGPPPASLKKLLHGVGAFTSPRRTVSGLTAAQALLAPDGSPHSIAQVLAHVHYWQEWMLGTAAAAQMLPFPEHADIGWPAVNTDEWDPVREGFLAGLVRADELASDETLLARKIASGSVELPGWNEYTVGFVLADLALHNAHHLGQIVLLRRMIGAWPPEGGGVSW